MQDKKNNDTSRPADEISSDLDALRELENAEWRLGWSRQFAIMLILIAAFVVIVWLDVVRRDDSQPIVVLGGITVGGDIAPAMWMGSALQQALAATIQASEQVRLITSDELAATFPRFGGGPGRQNGEQWVLGATLRAGVPEAGAAIVHLTLTRGGEAPAHEADIIGSANAIGDLAIRSVEQVYAWLDLDGLSREQVGFAQSEIPSPDASEAYGRGLAALAESDGRAALEFFREADTLAPNSAAIHDGLARAWDLLGYAQNAARESELAFEAGKRLSRRRQLELEAQFAMRSEAWPRAQQVFGALKEFNPNDLTYRLALADTQTNQNDGDGLLESVRQMRALPAPKRDDPRIDLTESWYWYNTGDYARCQELAQAAEKKARSDGSQRLVGAALMSIGRCDSTYNPTVWLAAREIFNELGTRSREPEILRELGKHEYTQGSMPQSLAYLEAAVALSRELGNEPQLAASSNALAVGYDLRGWLAKGYELKKRVADYQKQRANLYRYSIVLENIGVSLFKMGRYSEAEAVYDQAEKIFLEIDDKIGIAWLPYRRGQIALRRGDIDGARALMTQAFDNAEERPEGNLALEASYELGLINYYAGDYEAAESLLADANRQYRDGELNLAIAESEIALARLDFEANDLNAVQLHLASAEEYLDKEAAYYSLSLQIEKTNFDLIVAEDDRRAACRALQRLAAGQEHLEYVARAQTKIAVCRYLLDELSFEQSDATLTGIEEKAADIFDARLAAGHARARLLQHAGRSASALAEQKRVREMAQSRNWRPHPMPDLKLGEATP